MSSPDPSPRIFLLSPATLGGVRGGRILAGESSAPFIGTLAEGGAVPLGDVYAFISSLYFRGKRTYALRFGRPHGDTPSSWIITPSRGLRPLDDPVDLATLRGFAEEDIDPDNDTYFQALVESAERLEEGLPEAVTVVLLGSIASGKYLEPLGRVFGRRLFFPEAFVGRGDMSRGGLLLRAAEAGEELDYVPAADAERRGSRPPKLPPRKAP